ncbi:hypothetical protein SPRG_00210 [Saprolegnia parasitica CBS 223.65]|uniref:ABC transporter domain-containing protein n=1 Tax=Saprolegnia parasitica (strain CBS 223.65) TaxID=695850 RepID=A0A067D9M4_SAPPC|nr:hypothetical protein SPRG_00210 [Saprolegnia parasitica CBS 223.65]KDO35361.1 hypothetical protein SPRG_00210 [Saprolegnia parasitica CBS 223.65]|eukprot:XP_012193707.1 hypothetical protein SPRG_00210 [Saprolegnia parasitica CBS 223.65]
MVSEYKIRSVLLRVLKGLDETLVDYMASMLMDFDGSEPLSETIAPFLVSSGFAADDDVALKHCATLQAALEAEGLVAKVATNEAEFKKLENVQSIDEMSRANDAEMNTIMERMWGFESIRKTKNENMEACANAQSQRQIRKEAKKELLEEERERMEADDDLAWEDIRVLPDMSTDNGERDIHVDKVTLSFKGQTLLSNTNLKLIHGRRYGLIGKNGAGKTTLLRFMSHYEIEGFPRHIRMQHVEQESASKLSHETNSVLSVVLACDYERTLLLNEEKELLATNTNPDRLNAIYDRLQQIDSDSAESRARTILAGLQFPEAVVDGPAKALSGGWRMRTALAGALFMSPDLLLLDEPTNHLDLEAVMWLENYLETYEKTLIVVSHDRNFLNMVTTDTIYMYKQQLTYHRGNFASFEQTQEEHLRQQRKAYEAQQMKVTHMQEFIDRFRCNAKKAPLVQSRVKALEKIMRTAIEEPEDPRAFKMVFPPPEPLGRPIISVENVAFQYAPDKPLLFRDVNFGIDMSSRIGILGVNGSGKSTLINLILGKLEATEGKTVRNPRVRISTFTQHHVDSLNLSLTAVENMKEMFPGHEIDEFRNHLGRFNLSGELAMKPCRKLSGGQKSRVGFAILTWRLPHVVVLDEPTNHLDIETIDALIDALRGYKGGVVIVSHDQHFVNSICDELWVVGNTKVSKFGGSMADYKKAILKN